MQVATCFAEVIIWVDEKFMKRPASDYSHSLSPLSLLDPPSPVADSKLYKPEMSAPKLVSISRSVLFSSRKTY